ncbi:MAG: hypothetical protein OEP48_13745 [Betaproteobacteria bacterium]|nr:hypothetical protein [Betaproteobacteria bacterium]MDH3438329.1 hypothetical protein [Betaproteobacteria bacterium]
MDEFEFFFEKEWSDGLPVVPPTGARVAAMLAGTRRDPAELIGSVPPLSSDATVRAIALHAVMAGCKPSYLPLLIGVMEAVLDERFNLTLMQATTSAGAPFVLVNGPHAREIGLHGGTGCFGPGFRANATIGRALRLMMMNLGGGLPGITALSGFGGPWRYTFCVAENEAESPWPSYAAARGFAAEENVVTAIPLEGPALVWDDVSEDPERLVVAIADMMSAIGGGNIFRQADMAVVLSPQHAELFARAGFSRADVHALLVKRAGRRLGEIKRGGIWRGASGAARWPFKIDLSDDKAFVPVIGDSDDLHLIVAGGSGSPSSLVMHGITVASRAVSRVYTL